MEVIETQIQTKVHVDTEVYEEVSEERQAIVHVTCTDQVFGILFIRIWPSTFLVQRDGTRKKLLHSFNIGKYPKYLAVPDGHVFTLVFEALDKGCDRFDLLEDIPEPGGFFIKDVNRNKTDVYYLEISGE
ncbi:MAG: hypothetical protein ACM3VS_16485 [Candidatus Dadabacteria bacterium]